MVNTRYAQDYNHELKRLIKMLSDINFENKKRFQKIHTSYGTWYCTVDEFTSCAFLLLVDSKYPQQSALRLKKSLQDLVYQVPRYFDKQTNLTEKLSYGARDLLINYDIDDDYQYEQMSMNSIQTIELKLDNGVPDQLVQKDHLTVRHSIDPEIKKILEQQRLEMERRSSLLTSQTQKQIASQYQLQQNSKVQRQTSLNSQTANTAGSNNQNTLNLNSQKLYVNTQNLNNSQNIIHNNNGNHVASNSQPNYSHNNNNQYIEINNSFGNQQEQHHIVSTQQESSNRILSEEQSPHIQQQRPQLTSNQQTGLINLNQISNSYKLSGIIAIFLILIIIVLALLFLLKII